MYVRWKKKKRQYGGYMLTASLVESKRVNGNPRQRVILHLGSISPDRQHWARITKSGELQASFWIRVIDKMHFAGIDDETQAMVCAALEQKVPRPADEDLQQQRRKRLKFLREYYVPEYVEHFEIWYRECGV